MKKLLVIDGNSIINRAFYGVRELSTSQGKPTNAVYGTINIIKHQLDTLRPDYAAVAFDRKAPTFRKKIYDGYKATRHPTPPELLAQFDDAKDVLRAMGLYVCELDGYEADDLLGTMSLWVHDRDDVEAYVFSGDRDLLQLIDDRTFVLIAGNTATTQYDRDAFFEKYSTTPEHLVDIKALMGDSSDNIPGVPGIGEKTAIKLIAAFGDLDGVYNNLDDKLITNSVRAKLTASRELAELSYTLAKIERHAPVDFTLEDIHLREYDRDALYRKFTELEFGGFINKWRLTAPVNEPAEAEKVSAEILAAEDIINKVENRFAIAVASDGFIALATDGCVYGCLDDLSSLAPLFDGRCEVVCYDSKALCRKLRLAGVEPKTVPRDVMLAAYVLNSSEGTSSVSRLATVHLGKTVSDEDARVLLELDEYFAKELATIGCADLYEKIELPTALLLAEIEQVGFKIDRTGLLAFGEELEAAAMLSENSIYNMAGHEFNINSPKQLGEVLFAEMGLPGGKKTKTGYSTSAEVLEKLRTKHPIIDEILAYRQVKKLYSTYIVGLTEAADAHDRVHTEFKQALTATGRLSSTEPNLQNIPIRTPLGRQMRKYFVADDGYVLVDADYSQIELRMLAHISGDENMIAAFRSGEDIHARTASAVFDVPIYEVDSELRSRAKAVNFGIVYGIGEFSLSQDLGITRAAAGEYIKSYLSSYPKIDAYLRGVVAEGKELGYVTTAFGRRRYIPELKSSNFNLRSFGERVAMNSPIQGSAADVMKLAMLKVDRAIKASGIDARIVMQVHDELIVEAREGCAREAQEILVREMENVMELAVPLAVDSNISKDWFE